MKSLLYLRRNKRKAGEEGMKKLSLQEVLEGIEDTRRKRSVWYPLHEVLFIMLTAVICGATSYAKVEMFGKSKEKWLKKYIALENGVPDACTFRNVIRSIDTQQLHTVFVEWMKTVVEHITGVVAIDGKQARRTKEAERAPLHVVSAFSVECGLVLGQLACEEKSNEITAIPKLLEMLEIEGCIVTVDAMGTQTEIAKKITEKGADYILALKENQKTLHENVRLYFEEYRKEPAGVDPACSAVRHSLGHGRYESRTCYISEEIGWLEGREKWSGLAGIGVIFSKVEQDEKISEQAHYFIYSRKGMTASQILEAKRSHWEIENRLHWVLDMQFREDESRARADNSAENLNILRHWAFNLLKVETSVRGSFSDKQFKCLLDERSLDKILLSSFCS